MALLEGAQYIENLLNNNGKSNKMFFVIIDPHIITA